MLPAINTSGSKIRPNKDFMPFTVLRFIVFTNLYISLCALVMCLYTAIFFSLGVNTSLLIFTASGTLCSYSFHWLLPSTHMQLSPREKWSSSNRLILSILFITGAAGALYAMILLSGHLQSLLPLILLTFLYSSGKLPRGPFVLFRKYFIGKTIYLALMWSLVTVYLPVVISNTAWNTSHTLFLFNRFFFLFAICILFDLRDKELDALQGIRSLITILTRRGIRYLYFISLMVSLFAGICLMYYGFSFSGFVILNFPVIAAALIFRYSTQTRSELWFYFVLDGLMMLSGAAAIFYAMFVM